MDDAKKRRVEVADRDVHVGTLLAVEQQRKCLAVADAEDRQRRQALGVGDYVAHVNALGGEGLAHEASVLLVAHSCEHRRFKPQARRADRRIGR